MTDETGPNDPESLQQAVDEFLDGADAAFEEYEKGYVDPDATLRVIEDHLDDLRAAAEE